MNLINADCFAFMGHGFCRWAGWYGEWWYGNYTASRQSTMSTCIYYIMASIMASNSPFALRMLKVMVRLRITSFLRELYVITVRSNSCSKSV